MSKFALCAPQVALRIRPLSNAEQEEGASIVAHRMDDQVGRHTLPDCSVCLRVDTLISHLQNECIWASGVLVCVCVWEDVLLASFGLSQVGKRIKYLQGASVYSSEVVFSKSNTFVLLTCHRCHISLVCVGVLHDSGWLSVVVVREWLMEGVSFLPLPQQSECLEFNQTYRTLQSIIKSITIFPTMHQALNTSHSAPFPLVLLFFCPDQ